MFQKVLAKTLRAIEEYNMIDDGDKIAVGLSGGKDSTLLLDVLNQISKFYRKKFTVMAITIKPDKDALDTSKLEEFCKGKNIEYVVYDSNIFDVVFNIRKEKNPCSLCANMRRGMLNSLANEYNCTKIALGHHMDDVMETFLLSLFYNGNIHTFAPVTYLSRSDIKTIRPFIFVEEKYTRLVSKQKEYPIVKKICPKDGYTKREDIKNLIKKLTIEIPGFRESIFGAIRRSNIKGWNVNKEENKN